MAAYTNLLLIAALCVGTVHSLTCYTCTSQSSNTNCMTATNCSASETSCMTSVVSGGIGSLTAATITKTCSSACVATGTNIVIFSSSVTCCSTNLCNTSGASSIKSTSTILAAALGAILVLLRSSFL
ncbi:lymphocyte antigen 6E-like [Hyla sarda]|uniref:lymphocyte antigen 6E-like n=1 Tax=Hyla sarda TaxID=327740 RepID=UPI0024C24F1E|nr:lymphocyte antigen 6E-like [Hyla sarda]